jgi:hypothetical protein
MIKYKKQYLYFYSLLTNKITNTILYINKYLLKKHKNIVNIHSFLLELNKINNILPNYENLNSFFILYDLSYSFINLCNIYSIKKYYYNDFFKIYLDIQNIIINSDAFTYTNNPDIILNIITNFINNEQKYYINLLINNLTNEQKNNLPLNNNYLSFLNYANTLKNLNGNNLIILNNINEYKNILDKIQINKLNNKYDFLRNINHLMLDTYKKIINSNDDLNLTSLRKHNNYKNNITINYIPLLCEKIRNYIYKNKNKLSNDIQKNFYLSNFKSLKCPLKQIIYNDNNIIKINDMVNKVNDIIERTFYFIKSYLLNQYENNLELPEINFNFVSMSVRALTINSKKGFNVTKENKILLDTLTKYYDDNFINIYPEKINAIGLSNILNSCKTKIVTSYKNNITTNYLKILKKYIKSIFDKSYTEEYKLLSKSKLQECKTEIFNDINNIFNDLTKNNELISNIKYHNWINENKNKLVPKNFEKNNINYDLTAKPNKYFKYIIFMNKELEKNKLNFYNCFSLKSSNVPSYIEIDTLTLITNFINCEKTDECSINLLIKENLRTFYGKIWNNTFKISNDAFKYNNNYVFNNSILTDGINVTILFVNKDLQGINILENEKEITFNYIDDLGKIETDKITEEHIKKEQEKLKNEIKKLKEKYNLVYTDPGKNPDLLYLYDDNNNFFRYTTKQRLHQTGIIKMRKRKKKLKKKNKEIQILENKLINITVKTCDNKTLLKNIKERYNDELKIKEYYRKEIFRKMKFWNYINTQRSERNLVNNINKIYGKTKEVMLIYGDWNGKNHIKGTISSPGIGLKLMLNKHFKILNFNEFRTSCMNYETQNKCINARIKTKNGKTKTLHSVLVSEIQKTEKDVTIRHRYQNRNRHAVINFKLIIDNYEKEGIRIPLFSRIKNAYLF